MHTQEHLGEMANLKGTPATLYTLFLPLNHNDGRRMQPERLIWAQRKILRYTGGLTECARGVGLWLDEAAKVYRDSVLPIQTVAPTGPEAEAWFAHLAAEMAVVLDQHQLFIFTQPVWQLQPVPPDLEQPMMKKERVLLQLTP